MELNKIKEYLKNIKSIDLERNKISSMIKDIEKKYPEEKDVYIEVSKYYLDKDSKESIKYLEKYVTKGGDNEEVKLLLVKLYKQEEQLKRARELIKSLKKTEEVEIESLRIAIELKDKKWIKEIDKDIKEKDIEIGEKEIEEICRMYEEDGEYDRERYYIERYKDKYKLPDIKYKYYERQGLVEQALKELIKNIDIENNKKEIVRIINENIEGYIKEATDIKWIIEEICKLIEEDDTSSESIQALSLILRIREIKGKQRKEIVELLMKYHEKSKKARAGNIFLNEAEILEKKIILKSKPRQMIVELTTKCNLKCIMCDQFGDNTVISEECYEYIKSIVPYLERVKWQGGEVFLYPKLLELLDLAGKHGVQQEFVTNGLLINDKAIKLIADYNIFVTLSIDSFDKKTYEQIRVGGKFESLLKTLAMIKNYSDNVKKINYNIIVVVMSLNYKQLYDIFNFAVEYKFGTVSFQDYIPKILDSNLGLSNQEKEFVLEQIKRFKLLNKIIVHTNISLNHHNDFNTDIGFKNKKNSNKIQIEDNIDIEQDVSVYHNVEDSLIDNISNIFCLSPWKVLCIDSYKNIRFACLSKAIRCRCSYFDVWNCKDVLDYRTAVLHQDYSVCSEPCLNNGDYSLKTKIGIL